MWFWCFIIACTAILLMGAAFQHWFWWSMIGFGVLWAVAILVQGIGDYWQDRTLEGQRESEVPTNAPMLIAASERASGEVAVGRDT